MSTLTVTQKTGPIASFEAVSAAADAIAAEGAIPSVRGVTARIGGGSPNTVGLHLRTWREQRPTVEARRQIVVDERIQALLAGQIAEAVSEATKTAAAERDARTEDLAEMEQRASALEAQLEQAETRAAELQERVQHQAGQIEALRAELDAVKADSVASIQQAKTDAAASIQQAKDAAAKQVEEAQAEAANERKKHDEMTRRLGVAEEKAAEVERLRANLAELTATHQKEHGARVDAEKTGCLRGQSLDCRKPGQPGGKLAPKSWPGRNSGRKGNSPGRRTSRSPGDAARADEEGARTRHKGRSGEAQGVTSLQHKKRAYGPFFHAALLSVPAADSGALVSGSRSNARRS